MGSFFHSSSLNFNRKCNKCIVVKPIIDDLFQLIRSSSYLTFLVSITKNERNHVNGSTAFIGCIIWRHLLVTSCDNFVKMSWNGWIFCWVSKTSTEENSISEKKRQKHQNWINNNIIYIVYYLSETISWSFKPLSSASNIEPAITWTKLYLSAHFLIMLSSSCQISELRKVLNLVLSNRFYDHLLLRQYAF